MSVQNSVIHSSQTLKTIQYLTVVNKLYIHPMGMGIFFKCTIDIHNNSHESTWYYAV